MSQSQASLKSQAQGVSEDQNLKQYSKQYLKPNVIVEPLINRWYAWSFLISPATAARYLTESHFKVMESFVASPQLHVSALKDPAMMGGPFINYDASRVDEIQALLEKTRSDNAALIGLSQAIAQLEDLLTQHPPGASLEPLYAQVPEALKGYVELVYDSHNHPDLRLIEGLLYYSDYCRPQAQSIALSLGDSDARNFVLSTPRLDHPEVLHLQLPFADPRLDQLFAMRHQPGSVAELSESFNLNAEQAHLFAQLFTTEPPSCQSAAQPQTRQSPNAAEDSNKPLGDNVRVRYLGHACVLIETADVSILCDPLVSYACLPEQTNRMARFSYADLPDRIDYALITHNHQDHVMLETLLQLRHKIQQVVVPTGNKGSLIDPSLKLALQQIGFSSVQTLDELEAIPLPGGRILSLPVLGEHGDLNIGTKNAYLIELNGRSILCAADSNNLEPRLYEHLHHLVGDLDLLFIGMECDGAPFTWAYAPLLTQPTAHKLAQTRRLDGSDGSRAIALVQQFNPSQVYVYAMGQEPWLTYITSINYQPDSKPILESNRLVEHCRQQGIESARLLGRKEIILSAQPRRNLSRPSPIPIPKATKSPQFGVADRTPANASPPSLTPPASTPTVHSANAHLSPAMAASTDSTTHLLRQLRDLNVRLWLDDGALRCKAPKGALTPELTAALKAQKPAIIALLQGQSVGAAELVNGKAEAMSTVAHPSEANDPAALGDRASQPAAAETPWQKAQQAFAQRSPDYASDILLDEDIQPPQQLATEQLQPPQQILLTGATGFLGAFLLYELLQQTEAQIHCLLRAESLADGQQKLKNCLGNYGLLDQLNRADEPHGWLDRITLHPGDLAQLDLGLNPNQFNQLSQTIDAIYHNGAWVHHASPYSQLRETNVLGTQSILRLACTHQTKPLHFTSTLSVLPAEPPSGRSKMYEQDSLTDYPVPLGGYTQSKWVAEILVAQARERGLPVTIHRPGPISGHSQTGAFNRNDFLYRLMQGYSQLGSAPIGAMPLDLIPVDYVSQAMVYLSQQPSTWGQTFHFIHPDPVSSDQLFEPLTQAGYPIQRVSYGEWYQQLMAIAQSDPTHALYPLVSLFSSRRNSTASENNPVNSETENSAALDVPFDCQNVWNGLKASPVNCPALDHRLFSTYIQAMQRSGALSPPRVHA